MADTPPDDEPALDLDGEEADGDLEAELAEDIELEAAEDGAADEELHLVDEDEDLDDEE